MRDLPSVRLFLLIPILILTFAVSTGTAACGLQSSADERAEAERAMDAIGLEPGMVIGEAGAGGGRFTVYLAERVGETGRVFANDIVQRYLNRLERRMEGAGLNNVETVLGEIDDPLFPRGALEMVIMAHAFHDFEKPIEWLINLKPCLKPDAIVVNIDVDPALTGDHHHRPKDLVLRQFEQAGYQFVREENVLSDGYFILIFRAKE
jgi:ubiquinone/menaquinone biosynthesis C-methylase UbiE